ncbi:glycoside hydrolase family 78 protein [Cohnella caldifontis]|uniref:glycoside hydrolase family 78 protein n=1 Tax=Cohnella caldifontis TaxID=3027471 RepID=UPI0023EE1423|nr:glycoside hydrolase family 78 protein [Cohnella sp. YIM B05605]
MDPQWAIRELRCEYKENPVGLDVPRPRFSWKLVSGERAAVQSACQIQVSTDPMFGREPLWDTGRVDSDQSIHFEYAGPALKPRTRYWYRVRAWNGNGRMSAWSEPAFWETGLRSPEGWQARWIAAGLAPPEGEDPCDYVRASFRLRGKPVSARIYATARGLYRLYVNGAEADDTRMAPGWTSYGHRLQYQTYDVTGLLSAGDNAIGATLGNGWYAGYLAWENKRRVYGDERSLLLQLHVTYADGSEDTVVSAADGRWKAGRGALRMSELYHGETYDARIEPEGWLLPGFDDSAWEPVSERDDPFDTLIAQENEPVRVTEVIRPVASLVTPRGELVLDMGQNMVGWMRFTVREAPGAVIRLEHAEVLDRDGNFYTGNMRSARNLITYVCKGGGAETYEPHFSFQGFRYVKITGLADTEGLLDRFAGCVVHTDLEPAGSFETSDGRLNRLYRNIVWGQRGNFLDVPTDCPQRDERLGWTGDAQVFVRTSTYPYNVAPFFAKWLRDLAADQRPDGGVPFVIPFVPFNVHFDEDDSNHSSAAWGDAAVICPWTMYEVYGDRRLLEEQYPSMKAWIEYIRAQGGNEYLWNTGFHFGDWLALDGKEGEYIGQTPTDLIATAYYAHGTSLLSRAARALGRTEDEQAYRRLHDNVVQHFRLEFVSPNGRVIAPTQTAYALVLAFDLLEETHRPQAAARLEEMIRKNGYKLTTGFVGTPYLCPVLSRFGYHDAAYRLVMQEEYPSWLYSVKQGATTIWEHWDGIKPDGTFWSDDMNSYNHYAYGSVGEWLFRVAAGIDTAEGFPGYKRIRIAPRFGGGLTFVKAAYESVHGTIRSRWALQGDGRITVEVSIPPNTEAEVELPGATVDGVTESGLPVSRAVGVFGAEAAGGVLRLRVGSGDYRFEFSRNG